MITDTNSASAVAGETIMEELPPAPACSHLCLAIELFGAYFCSVSWLPFRRWSKHIPEALPAPWSAMILPYTFHSFSQVFLKNKFWNKSYQMTEAKTTTLICETNCASKNTNEGNPFQSKGPSALKWACLAIKIFQKGSDFCMFCQFWNCKRKLPFPWLPPGFGTFSLERFNLPLRMLLYENLRQAFDL